jgi:hypothetical protein
MTDSTANVLPFLKKPDAVTLAMSASGTKRTSAGALHMSAFGGKADMPFCTANVR